MKWFNRLFDRIRPENPQTPAAAAFWRYVPRDLRLSREEQTSLGAVWAAIRAISDPLACAPWNVYGLDAKGRRVLVEDPVSYLLSVRPNGEMTAVGLWEGVLWSMATYGNAYVYVQRDGGGRPLALVPMLADRVRLVRAEDDSLLYCYTQPSGEVVVPAVDVLHFRGPTSTSTVLGDAILDRAAKSIALGVAVESFAASYFQNGATVAGYLKVNAGLDDEGKEALRAQWSARYGAKGGKGSHKVAVLPQGVEYVSTNVDGKSAQMVEARAASVEDIARAFSVPLLLMGTVAGAQGYGSNLTTILLDFARRTLAPWQARLALEIQAKLLAPGRWVEADLSRFTRGTEFERMQAAEVAIRCGAKSINEVREQEGDPDIKGGDVHLVMASMTTLDRVINPPEPEPAPVQQQEPTQPPQPAAPDQEDQPDQADQEAITNLVSAALSRHAKRAKARTADLRRQGHTQETITANLTTLAPKAREEIAALLKVSGRAANDPMVNTAIESVDAGVEPTKAAQHLLAEVA